MEPGTADVTWIMEVTSRRMGKAGIGGTMPALLKFPGGDDPARAGCTARTEAREKIAATITALAPMTRISSLEVPGPPVQISRRTVGPVCLIEAEGIEYCQTATARTTNGVPEGLSLAVRPVGRWSLSQAGVTRSSEAEDFLTVVDVTRAMRVELSAETKLWQMFFSAGQLGLSVDAIRAGAAVIERSPLRQLVASHVLHLPDDDTDLLPPEALRSVGYATIELVRAMLISAARPAAQSGSEVSGEHLRHAIKQYVRRHLRDPGLSPAVIARVHHISARHLYNIWEGEQLTMSRWISQQRLQAAGDDLANPRLAYKSIAALGREWGFPSPAHFARRFRAVYGVSPRDWRSASEIGR